MCDQSLVQLILNLLDHQLVLSHLSGRVDSRLERLLSLLEFFLGIPVLIFKHDKSPISVSKIQFKTVSHYLPAKIPPKTLKSKPVKKETRMKQSDLLLFVFELLGEGVGFVLETHGLRLVLGGLVHAGTLRVAVSVVHLVSF